VERFTGTGRVHRQNGGGGTDHREGVCHAARGEAEPAGPKFPSGIANHDHDLAVEHVEGFVGVGVAVQWCELAALQVVFESEQGASGLASRRFPDVEPAAVEPTPVAFLVRSHDPSRRHHVILSDGTHYYAGTIN